MKAFYFPHDDNAAGDERVLKLRAKFGNTEGYAMWFMLLEYLSRNNGNVDAGAMQELSICYAIPAEKWHEFVTVCCDIGLLHKNRNVMFSPRLLDAMKERDERKEQATKAANVRWGKPNDGKAKSNAGAYAGAMPGEERRGEERILKKPTKKSADDEATKTTTGKVDDSPPAEPTRAPKTDEQVEQEFFALAMTEWGADEPYRQTKQAQLHELRGEDRTAVLKKMRVAVNASHSSSDATRRLARKIYHEAVGLMQDRALDGRTLDGVQIAKRRAFAADESSDSPEQS